MKREDSNFFIKIISRSSLDSAPLQKRCHKDYVDDSIKIWSQSYNVNFGLNTIELFLIFLTVCYLILEPNNV